MLKVCRGCGKEMDIAANRAFCRYCRKNRPEIYVLWTRKKRLNAKERLKKSINAV